MAARCPAPQNRLDRIATRSSLMLNKRERCVTALATLFVAATLIDCSGDTTTATSTPAPVPAPTPAPSPSPTPTPTPPPPGPAGAADVVTYHKDGLRTGNYND